jgi:hypothetical protein
MKHLAAIFFLSVTFVYADEITTSTGKDKVIVVQKGDEKLLQAPKVFVESGSDDISGSPEDSVKAAYRTWDQKCTEWKSELKRQNGSNLMIASCGTPTRNQDTHLSEKTYSYHSKANYKIKVVGK